MINAYSTLFLTLIYVFSASIASAQIGAIDASFVPTGSGVSGQVNTVVVQPDGKVLIGGSFTSYNGITRNRIARLNVDGTLDLTFNPTLGFNNDVNSIALQSSGKIIVGGKFTSYEGLNAGRYVRLNADGTRDASFYEPVNGDLNNDVEVLVVLPSDEILMGGSFTALEGSAFAPILKLKADGIIAYSFNPGAFNSLAQVNAIAVQSDGKIIVGGEFTSILSFPTKRIARLKADGSYDGSFISGSGFDAPVNAIVIQPGNKIVVGGDFTSYDGTSTARICRLETTGVLETGFTSGISFDNSIFTMALQSNGQVVVGGKFQLVNSTISRKCIARINAEGSLDITFNPGSGFSNHVNSISLMAADGRVVAGGLFTTFDGTSRNFIARLLNHSITIQSTNPTAPWCAGSSVQFIYSVSGTFNPSKVFSVELSDVNGNFSTPTSIGISPGTGGGSMYSTIPPGTALGTGYAVRILSTDPPAISEDPLALFSGLEVTATIPSVSIAASPSGAVCSTTSVTYTATVVNGGTPSYIWFRNGVPISTNSSTYVDNMHAQGDEIYCEATSTATCASPATVTSSSIFMTVNPTTTASATVTANPAGQLCDGTSVAFTAAALNAGVTPIYQWKLNNVNVGTNSSSYTNAALVNGNQVKCWVTSTAACPSQAAVNSNTITVNMIPIAIPSGTIFSDLGNTICAGSTVTFTAAPSNVGSAPTYLWTVNGVDQGEPGTTFVTNALDNGDVVLLTIINNDICADPTPVATNSITMTVIPVESPLISITASPAGQVCDGTDITFTANYGSVGNFPSFQWTVNGNPVWDTDIYTDATLSNGDVVQCTVVSNAACPDPTSEISNSIVINELPIVVPSISISSDLGTSICEGSAVTFTANATNQGSSPVYTWFLNSVAIVQSGSTYVTSSLMDGDEVECGITNSDGCVVPSSAISDSIAMMVIPVEVPIVSISSDAGTPLCVGTNVTFTASADNAGTSPIYQWEVDGNIVGTNSDTYADATLVNDAVVTCTITSNAPCPSTPSATSNSITMAFDATETLTVSISSSPSGPVCIGTNITFTADASSALATPLYQWTVNGNAVGSDSPIYSDVTLVNNDVVQCTVTSNAACPSVISAISNDITIVITETEVPSITI
jgi:uncharacterized delta-60 repeat protein